MRQGPGRTPTWARSSAAPSRSSSASSTTASSRRSTRIRTTSASSTCPREGRDRGPLKVVLRYSEAPIVSIDINHAIESSTCKMVKVLLWYDNEWGFSNRMVDMVQHIGSTRGSRAAVRCNPRRREGHRQRPGDRERAGCHPGLPDYPEVSFRVLTGDLQQRHRPGHATCLLLAGDP